MAEYTKVHNAWADYPDTSTPITASALDTIEAGIANAVAKDAVTVAGTRLVSTKLLAADTHPAFRLYGNGSHEWGAGGASATDTNLYRAGIGVLKTDGEIDAASVIYSGIGLAANSWAYGTYASGDTYPRLVVLNTGALQWGGGSGVSDTNLYRSAANILTTDDTFTAINVGGRPTASGNEAMFVDVSGDTQRRFQVLGSGTLNWGPGNAATDTNLYRSAANTLKSDDGIWGAGGLVTLTKAGVPSDTDLVTGMQQSGAMILDTTNSRIYFRVGSTWKYAALV